MKEYRQDGATGASPGRAGAGLATPGKRTLIEQTQFGAATVVDGDPISTLPSGGIGDGPRAAPPAVGGDVENPLAPNEPVPLAPRPKVTLSMPESAGAPITFAAADYDELYQLVAARATTRQEAGRVLADFSTTTGPADAGGNVSTVAFDSPLITSLPEWPRKGQQPADDQRKFNEWHASVDAHEKTHRDIYKREYPKLKTTVIGPTEREVYAQRDAVLQATETLQDAFDNSSQPAPLAAPGGIQKVPRNATDPAGPQPGPTSDNPAADSDTAAV